MNVTVRCWQTDRDSVRQRVAPGTQSLWDVPHGIAVDDDRGHTARWAVRTVLSCQRARQTERV